MSVATLVTRPAQPLMAARPCPAHQAVGRHIYRESHADLAPSKSGHIDFTQIHLALARSGIPPPSGAVETSFEVKNNK
jgi:hypothetical protein